MTIYVPGTEEQDLKKVIMALQNIAALLQSPWIAYTTTATAQTGALTAYTATGRYKNVGSTVQVQADVTITTAGTGAGNLRISLPFTATAFFFIGVSREIGVTDKLGSAAVSPSSAIASAIDYSNTTFIADGHRVAIGVTYEMA